jgi:hypothetical protein
MNQFENKLIRKQSAKKGFVIDMVNNCLSQAILTARNNHAATRAEIETYSEIIEKILIDKLGITQTDIDKIKVEISSRNSKDNQLLKTYWSDTTKTESEKLDLMIKDGLSEKSTNEIKKIIEIKKDQSQKIENK